jgi:hypothetical protein
VYLKEKWVFVADVEIKSVSVPVDIPVICHVAVEVPENNVPILTVCGLTEKCPFCEVRVAETPVNCVYLWALLMFSISTLTVCVSPTCMVVGK